MTDDEGPLIVNAAGEARDPATGEVVDADRRRRLMQRLREKRERDEISTVEARCLAALEERERRKDES